MQKFRVSLLGIALMLAAPLAPQAIAKATPVVAHYTSPFSPPLRNRA